MNADREATILKYIALTQIKGLGSMTQNGLINICRSIDACFEDTYEELIDKGKRQSLKKSLISECRIRSFLTQRDDKNLWIFAEGILRLAEKSGITVIIREDAEYPDRYKNIDDMPVVLYSKGNLRINEFDKSIGVVGARRCSLEGKEKSVEIAVNAAERGVTVISGMAKGVDSYAHTAALKSKGYTVAVLGNGPDICYPKEHIKLYNEIGEHGCILSEYPPGMPPLNYHFPKRNRLIAALSDKLFVIEAGRNSGALITAEYAKKYGREIINPSLS